jgi:hypothetical protein
MKERSDPAVPIVSERAPGFDDATLKVGLLMESAQAHQKLAEGQLERLRAHTQDLDGVVRDEIRRTLVEELQMLTAEAARASHVLEGIRGGGLRTSASSVLIAVLCTLLPIGIARWALPSAADISALRSRRDELRANLIGLEQQGGRVEWRRCGEAKRLCIRVDRKAPAYGETGDFVVIAGY